ncbi:unnamed protein product, partial [Polarella glacialis]
MADPVKFQEAISDPGQFVMPFLQLALHRAVAKLRPHLEPFLKWYDITSLIDGLTSIEHIEETISDPDSLLSLLRLAARFAAKAHLRLNWSRCFKSTALTGAMCYLRSRSWTASMTSKKPLPILMISL